MEGAARVLVHLSRGGARPQRAAFLQSVTGHFCAPYEDTALVSASLDCGRLVLADHSFPGSTSVLLQRPPFCPMKLLAEPQTATLPAELRGRGVDVGVAVLLQTSDRRVLLTRRAPGLSIFPNIWVPPGGHVEPDEQLLEVGLRELQEETGLRLEPGAVSWRMLGLWESVFPPRLSRGLPRRHHIVAYLLLLAKETHQQLEARMQPDESEVSAYAWLEPPVLESIVAAGDMAESLGQVPSHLPATVRVTELSGGQAQATELPTATLLNTAPAHGEDVERVSTGTKFALQLWLDTTAKQQSPRSSSS
ncbi:nucleoside diphosphate-linked moiety X motif 17 isoform X1 [Alligator mississippiensis]|uniref:m7GpppN-mRNA hydrolase NUDT17 n=1 Tax=Alligator mississippiensis TaxID=8496 RepID=A0A151NY15_ALLMI|nr:nucleoside diphosphate-linked moiety X motif 17 isoform X1 [Alligator mississippiensis]KYO41766.1 nucleoside diphosphate-linked moiety X motif 17 [Alligator mississippiensis]